MDGGQISLLRRIFRAGNNQPRAMLRHTLATLAYRAAKTLRGEPDEFPGFRAAESCRTPIQILAHLGDLMDWALAMARGKPAWHDSVPLAWSEEKERFFRSVQAFEDYLASDAALQVPAEKLFQGPIADALTHVGQIALLRRMARSPIRGENYFVAEIESGRVGSAQSAPRREFE